MNIDFLNCRICGMFVRVDEEIYCFNCGSTAHSTCLPPQMTRNDFVDLATHDFLHVCLICSSKIREDMNIRMKLKQAQLFETLNTSKQVLPFTLPNDNTLSAMFTTQEKIKLNVNNSTQTQSITQIMVNNNLQEQVFEVITLEYESDNENQVNENGIVLDIPIVINEESENENPEKENATVLNLAIVIDEEFQEQIFDLTMDNDERSNHNLANSNGYDFDDILSISSSDSFKSVISHNSLLRYISKLMNQNR